MIELPTDKPDVLHLLTGFAGDLLSHGRDLDAIALAPLLDPACPVAHLYAAVPPLLAGAPDRPTAAERHLEAAAALGPGASPRIVGLLDSLTAWARGDPVGAAARLRALVEDSPADLVAAKLCQTLELRTGDNAGLRRTAAALLVGPAQRYAAGLAAYALAVTGEPERALDLGRAAIARDPRLDPWAQHAVAHALAALDRPDEARAFLRFSSISWDRCAPAMRQHLWAHLAGALLDGRDHAGALALFDDRLLPGARSAGFDDAAALLVRLEAGGFDASERWAGLAATVPAGDRARRWLGAFAAWRGGAVPTPAALDSAGQLALAGLIAHHQRRYHDAAIALGRARAHPEALGPIERGLINLLLRDSLVRRHAAA